MHNFRTTLSKRLYCKLKERVKRTQSLAQSTRIAVKLLSEATACRKLDVERPSSPLFRLVRLKCYAHPSRNAERDFLSLRHFTSKPLTERYKNLPDYP